VIVQPHLAVFSAIRPFGEIRARPRASDHCFLGEFWEPGAACSATY
jgi:hypothetical protein